MLFSHKCTQLRVNDMELIALDLQQRQSYLRTRRKTVFYQFPLSNGFVNRENVLFGKELVQNIKDIEGRLISNAIISLLLYCLAVLCNALLNYSPWIINQRAFSPKTCLRLATACERGSSFKYKAAQFVIHHRHGAVQCTTPVVLLV